MQVQRKNSSRLIDRLITYVGFIVFIAMATETSGQDDLNCYGNVDVVFVIDASLSLSPENFTRVCTFTRDTYILLDEALAGILRSAVIPFASKPYDPILSLTKNSTAVISYLEDKERETQNVGTKTGKAMLEAIKVFEDDWDPDTYKVVVVVTDGPPDIRNNVLNAMAQLTSLGVKVIIVGIGTPLNFLASAAVIHDNATLSAELMNVVAKDVCKDTVTSLPIVDKDDVAMDIMFVMDEAHADATRFDMTKRFIMLIMNTFNLSSGYAQVSILKYGRSVLKSEQHYISLRYLELFSAMGQLSLNLLNADGARNFREVFKALHQEINAYGTTGRPFIVVLFMSGIGDDEQEIINLADGLRQYTNVYLLIVATGDMTGQLGNPMMVMNLMAYDPALVFQTEDYGRLAGSTQESKDFIALVRQSIYNVATGNLSTNTGPVRWSAAVDVMFLIDGSADMEFIPHFAIVKRFILQLVDTFTINPGRVALCVYDNAGVYDTRGYELNYNHDEFKKQLNSISLIKRTSTADPNQGLDGILKYSDANRKEGSHQIAYLITYGQTNNEILSLAYARAIARRGIQLMVIGIGNNVVTGQLQALQMFGGPVTITDLNNIASAEMLHQFKAELQQYANITRPVGTYFEWSDGFDMLILIHTELARADGGISLKSAMIDIVQRYSSSNARIGIITFGEDVHTEISTEILLSESATKQMLILKIVSLTITPSGGPNVLAALNQASQRFDAEGRADVPHLIMIMFQGDIGLNIALMNKIMEMKQAGIAINSFGFGLNTDIAHTRSLAFHSDTAYSVRQPLEYSVTMDANVIALARNEFVPSQVGDITVLDNVCHDKAGIIFLIDISASMTDYFDAVKRFLAVLISGFDMTEYGFVPFSTTVVNSSVVKLGQFTDYVENYIHLMNLEMDEKLLNTMTFIAINYAIGEFNISKYLSDNAPEKIIMIVSDGNSANRQETIKAANDARDNNITVLGVGVGTDYDKDELGAVVEDINNLFNITSNDTLNTEILLRIQTRICQIIRPGDCLAGNYRVESTSECLPCAVGYYQPNDEQLSCIKCQDGYSTSGPGTTSTNDCIQTCDVGEYFKNVCELCPLNTYKNTSGAAPCSPCPSDKPITKATGSASIDACMADVCLITMDLMLVIDASASIDIADFNLLKVVLISLLEKFNIKESNGTRVAIATIGSETTEEDVSDFSNDEAKISMNIRSMQSGALTTNTASAFKMVRQKVQEDPRSNIPIVVLVITDGLSADPYRTTLEAALLQQYANIVALGVGEDFFLEELYAITSATEYVLTESNYFELQSLDISDTICKAAEDWIPYEPPVIDVCNLPMDLVFVMDLSVSASDSLDIMLKMNLLNSLDGLPIGNDTVHVGVFSYADGISSQVLVPSYDKASISTAILNQLPPGGLSTDTHDAIAKLIDLFEKNPRPNALKVAMIFTDGLSTLPDLTRNKAADAKALGIHLIAVGPIDATGAERNELGNISSTGQGGVVYATGGYFSVTPEQVVMAACPGLSVCYHPIDAVFIWYIADEDTWQAQTTQLTGDISARFDMMTAGLIKVSAGTTVDTLAKALSEAGNQLLVNSDVIRTIVVMTDQDPIENVLNEVSDLKDDGVIITVITPDDIPGWIQYASLVYTNQNFGDILVTTEISWSICKAPCLSGYDINDDGYCGECPLGSYRSRTESYQCVECGPEWNTLGTGKTSRADCRLIEGECLGGFEKLDDGTCSPCPKDMYRERYKQLPCEPCPFDFFTRFSGSEFLDDCLPMCGIGTYWSSLTEDCKECESGTYNDVPNQFVCKPCHEDGLMVTVDDTRSIVTGATSEDQCVGNCEPGTFWNNTECMLCPENTFQNEPRRDYCASCRPGTISNAGSTFETDCNDPCQSGTTYDFELKSCVPCGLHKYRDKAKGDNICQDCPAGLITETDTSGSETRCKSDCDPGQWWNAEKQKCFECPAGTYQLSPSSDSCIPCADGWTSPTGSNSSSNCKPPCTKGEMWDGKCLPCPLGTYQDEENQDTCKQCGPSTSTKFKGSTDASQCVGPCDGGQWICRSNNQCVSGDVRCDGTKDCTDGTDEDGCDCEPGKFYDEVDSVCKVCAVGSFQEIMGQLTCLKCPVGTSTATSGSVDGTDCKDICEAGYKYVIDGSSYTCEECGIGEFRKKNRDGPLQCIPCPKPFSTQGSVSDDYDKCISKCDAGQYYNVEEKKCTECLPGYYQEDIFDEYQCVKCDIGLTTDGPGANRSADCIDVCDIGTELPISGTTKDDCVNCSSGSFRVKDMAICDWCGNGFTSSPGSDSVSDCYPDCKAGQEFNEDETGCLDCSLGSFTATKPTPEESSCNWCGPGKVTDFTASKLLSDCKDVCNSGLGLSEDKTECVVCPIGTYRVRFENDVCTPCPTGSTTLTEGATSSSFCKNPCDPGKTMNSLGSCVLCGYDKYRGDNDQLFACLPCEANKITYIQNATSAAFCYPLCEPGSFLNNRTSECQNCPNTEYQDKYGQQECIPCPKEGFHTNGVNRSLEIHCKADWCNAGWKLVGGKFPIGKCVPCGKGFYRGDNDTKCKPCGIGLTTATDTAESSDECQNPPFCEPGSFLNITTSACQNCPYDQYQNEAGQLKCKPCPTKGYHTNGVNRSLEIHCKADWCNAGLKLVGGDPPIGKCLPCGIGFYRGDDDPECWPCGNGLTTATDTAKSKAECLSPLTPGGACLSGHEPINGVCVACQYGFYRTHPINIRCVPCPGGQTTHRRGATSADLCILDGIRCSMTFDLVIVVDLSRPSCNFDCVRSLSFWLMNLVSRLDVHANKVRVGIIRYGSGTSTLVDLHNGISSKRLHSLLSRGLSCSPNFKANAHLALRNAEYMFKHQSRRSCVKKMLLMTANHNACPDEVMEAIYRLKNANVHLTVISTVPSHALQASDMNSQFVITDFTMLPPTQNLIRALC